MYPRYGFEVEGFQTNLGGTPVVPDFSNTFLPLDGFPGLIELRSTGGKSLSEAYTEVLNRYLYLPRAGIFCFSTHEHKFSGKDMALLREKASWRKEQFKIRNVYGKSPRRLGNKTLASCQINISSITRVEEVRIIGKDQVKFPACYGLFDVGAVVKALDEEFRIEIEGSNRQPGMFAIKDYGTRLEYRSLPNSVFPFDPHKAAKFLDRIKNAVEGAA